jgi:hypothetical protein
LDAALFNTSAHLSTIQALFCKFFVEIYDRNSKDIRCFGIEMALLQAKLISPEDKFTFATFEHGTLHNRCLLKMTQVTNTLLLPLIQDKEKSNKVAFKDRQDNGNALLYSNSFIYKQISVSGRFTLY